MSGLGSSPRAWLRRLAISAALGLATGAVVFLVARGVSGAALLVQQQQLLREVAGALGDGVEALAGSDLRAARLRLEAIDAQYRQISALLGLAAGAAASVASFVRMEMAAS